MPDLTKSPHHQIAKFFPPSHSSPSAQTPDPPRTVLRYSHAILLAAAALLTLGVLMVPSAGMTLGSTQYAPPTADAPLTQVLAPLQHALLHRHTMFAAVAVAAMLVASRIDARSMFGFIDADSLARAGHRPRRWTNPLGLVVALSFALVVLTFIPGFGREVNGSARWIRFGGFGFQPSELLKWTAVLTVAWWCARRRGSMHRFWAGLCPALAFTALAAGLVGYADLGTGLLIAAVCVAMLLAGGARWWHLAAFAPAGAALVVAAIVAAPYRVQRLLAFMDPWADPMGTGYHPIASMTAFASGGVFGRGLGNSIQKYHLPEDTTDFVFPILSEELGLAGATLTLGLFLTLLWIGLAVVTQSRDTFSRMLGLGILLTVGLQALINLSVVTVVVPTKGIALPLVSAGGTGWIMTAFMLGLVAALDNAHQLRDRHLAVA